MNMPTMRYRNFWLRLHAVGHLPCNALLTALCTCFGISLQLHQTPCRPHYVPVECELTSPQCSLWKTQSVVLQYIHRFLFFFFTNKHTLVLAYPQIHVPTYTHTHQRGIKANSVLGLLLCLGLVLSPSFPLPHSHSWKRRLALNSGLWYGNVMVVEEGRWDMGDGRWIPLSAAVG